MEEGGAGGIYTLHPALFHGSTDGEGMGCSTAACSWLLSRAPGHIDSSVSVETKPIVSEAQGAGGLLYATVSANSLASL